MYSAADKGAGRLARTCNGFSVSCKLGISTITKPRKEITIPAALRKVIFSLRIIFENIAMNEGAVVITKLATPEEARALAKI
ncbi:MAG: hypothetical protein O2U61_05305 [Candidatus Bathyarchaeota archaeon]|nr:hypothetical protein [Candidatus Bathyarchaeota archaeon]